MSASREKKMRKESNSAATNTPDVKKGNGKTVLTAVIAIVAVAIVVLSVMITSGFFEAHTTAVTLGQRKISPVEVNYWLGKTYAQEQSAMSYLIDTELPLTEQDCPEEGYDTWYDYILDLAMDTAASTYAVYDEAVAAGFELSEEGQTNLDTQMETLELYDSMYGYNYLASMYGPGSSNSSYEDFLTVTAIAQEYSSDKFAGIEYTAEDLEAYYADHAEEIDVINFRIFELPAEVTTAEDGTETVTEESLAAAEIAAIALAEASVSEEAYLEQVMLSVPEDQQEGYDPAEMTAAPSMTQSESPEFLNTWLNEVERTAGDVCINVNEDNTGYYVIYFLGYADMSIKLPSVRHILIRPEEDEEGNISDEAWVAAEEQANEVLAQYEAGEQTEEAFAALVEANSADTGSTGNGGLYENIAPGQMVDEFNDWCFAARTAGDTGIVKTTYGYHVMYFCGESTETYRDINIETAKRNSDYTAWEEEVSASVSYKLVSDKYIMEI